MPDITGVLYRPAPTPDEVAAAMRRARQLRSEVMSGYLATACGALGRTFRHMPAGVVHPEAMIRRDFAPSWTARRSFWSMLPGSPTRAQTLWKRVPRT